MRKNKIEWLCLIFLFIIFPLDCSFGFVALSTQEGLVGHKTSNKHEVVVNDWFVALPSPRRLAPLDAWSPKVKISQC